MDARYFLTEITVQGYKSIRQAHTVAMRPLTILAGANSSGKSSLMQPLLLLKQTLEAAYDPGPLLLNGPNVRFNNADQMFNVNDKKTRLFKIGLRVGSAFREVTFQKRERRLEVISTIYEESGVRLNVTPEPDQQAIAEFVERAKVFIRLPPEIGFERQWSVARNRCFLQLN